MSRPTTDRRGHGRILACLSVVYAAAVLLTGGGCATRHARHAPEYTWRPRVYPATRYAARGKVVQHAMDAVGFEYTSGWLLPDNLFQGLVLSAVVYGYSLVVEIPISIVTDTVALPYDLRQVDAFQEAEAFFKNALLGSAWPETPEALRTRYVPISSDAVIRDFVERPDTPLADSKLRVLVDAGLGLELVARSPHVDAGLAMRVVERATPAGTNWPAWTVDPDLLRAKHLRTMQRSGRSIADVPEYRNMTFADFLRGQMMRNTALPPDALIQILDATESETRHALLEVLRETAYPLPTFEALRLHGDPELLMAIAVNPHVPQSVLTALAGDSTHIPRLARLIARHPHAHVEVLERLSASDDSEVRLAAAANPSLPGDRLALLAQAAHDDPGLGARIAANPNTSLETLGVLIDHGDPTVGLAVFKRYDLPAGYLDRLAALADGDSDAARRLGVEVARHPETTADALDRLARIEDFGARWAVASHPNTRPETLDSLAELAGENDLYGVAVAGHPNTRANTLRRLGERDNLEINEQVARHPSTPPETLRRLASHALHILSQPVSGETYRAMVTAAHVTTHPHLSPEDARAITEALCGLAIPTHRLDTLARIIDHPEAPAAALETILRHLSESDHNHLPDRQDRTRAAELRRKAEHRLAARQIPPSGK